MCDLEELGEAEEVAVGAEECLSQPLHPSLHGPVEPYTPKGPEACFPVPTDHSPDCFREARKDRGAFPVSRRIRAQPGT